MKIDLLTHEKPLGEEIARVLKSGLYSDFKCAVAYAKNSGVSKIYDELIEFLSRGGKISVVAGIDQWNTSYQALINLKSIAKNDVFIHHDKNPYVTFHPKIYLFGNRKLEKIIIGSSNFTAGGFFLNREANVDITLDDSKDAKRFQTQATSYWKKLLKDKNTKRCDFSLLEKLFESGVVADENKQKHPYEIIGDALNELPFKAKEKTKAPPSAIAALDVSVPAAKKNFAMNLSRFDVSPKSQDPIILIPIAAIKTLPSFWNFPMLYTASDAGYPQFYGMANIGLDGKNIKNQYIRIYYYHNRREMRLQCEQIKRNGRAGDIITIFKNTDNPLEFEIKLLRTGSERFKQVEAMLTQRVSQHKSFAYY